VNRDPARIVRDAAVASAVMTLSQSLEMRATHRPPSEVPVITIERVLRRTIPAGRPRIVAGHIAQGTLALTAVLVASQTKTLASRPARVVLGGAALVVADATLATAMGIAPPPWRWTWRETATDLSHKTVLMAAADALAHRSPGS
jgi:hypothetical protein